LNQISSSSLRAPALGALLMLSASLVFACGNILQSLLPQRFGMSSTGMAFWQYLIASVLMVGCAFWFEDPFAATPPPEAVWSVIWMGIFPTAVATIVYFQLIRMAGASFMALTNYLIPGISVLLGMVVLGERPGWNAFAGMILILAGVAIAQSAWKPRRA
jgi:drug/metabolite transporter (DMT)-like permease